MNQVTTTMNQISTLLSLYSEFIATLIAASVLSLFVGWMLCRSFGRKRMDAAERTWTERYQALEDSASADTENLEEQLQEIAGEIRNLKSTNRTLNDSLKKHDSTIQTARAEAIELNRQHAEMQERLQRIIQQKEKEMAELTNRATGESGQHGTSGSTYSAPAKNAVLGGALLGAFSDDIDDSFEETLPENIDSAFISDNHSSLSSLSDLELNTADTVAINPADLLDATVQMSASDFIHENRKSSKTTDSEFDDFIEDTADVSGLFIDDMEESTLALDEDALDFAKHPFSVSNAD